MRVLALICALLVSVGGIVVLVGFISGGARATGAGRNIRAHNDAKIMELSKEEEDLDQFALEYFDGSLPVYSEEDALDLESIFSELDEENDDELRDFDGIDWHGFGAVQTPEQQLSDHRMLQNGPEMFEIGNNGKFNTPNNKCGNCQGDCDNDGECSPGLKCFQRSGNEQVPGCSIGPRTRSGIDYCYDPANDGSDGGGGGGGGGDGDGGGGGQQDTQTVGGGGKSSRLKLWWQPGYFWQEEDFERKWCLECCGGGCNNGDCIKIRECDGGNTKWQFVVVGEGRHLIKVSNENLCMTLEGRKDIKLRNCVPSNDKQQWWASPGTFNSDRFEIHPVTKSGCITQHHHPKDGEEIYIDTECKLARKWDTSNWNKY